MRQPPNVPQQLPPEIENALNALATFWAESPQRPRIDRLVLKYWDELVDSWIDDVSLPLYVRKSGKGSSRGSIVHHASQRVLIPTDNSPAHWSFMSAFGGRQPTLAQVRAEIDADRIPVAMALSRVEMSSVKFECCRGDIGNPNDYGWKLCHIRPVALRARGPLSDVPIEAMHRHFRDFMSPSNMFLIPKSISGLGELEHFTRALEQFRDHL